MRRLFLTLLIVATSVAQAQPDNWAHPELTWFVIQTTHFSVHYHDYPDSQRLGARSCRRTAEVVAGIAESVYEPLSRLYDLPLEKTHILIRDTDDYSNGAAYFYDNKVEIWATNLDYDLRGNHEWLENVVVHELTHMFSIQASMKLPRAFPAIYLQGIGYEKERRKDVIRGFPNVITSYPISGVTVPIWFAEGVAQYQSRSLARDSWDSHRDMILRERALSGTLLSLGDMSTFGKNSIGNESAYNSGFAFVTYLSSRHGEEWLKRLSVENARLFRSFEGAMEKVCGISLRDSYAGWQSLVTTRYTERTTSIRRHRTEGADVYSHGTANFHPVGSPDGTRIAFLTNNGSDYLSQTSLVIMNMQDQSVTRITDRVTGAPTWTSDGNRLLYARITNKNPHGSELGDLYLFDLSSRREIRLTNGLRLSSPCIGPADTTIVAVQNVDGTNNLLRLSGLNVREMEMQSPSADVVSVCRLTTFADGTQIYRPTFNPDGSHIYFDWSRTKGRDIASLSLSDLTVNPLLSHEWDDRSPAFSADGQVLYFASDRSGIYNLYRMNLESQVTEALTNTTGGCFYPSVARDGALLFTLYRKNAFRIAHIRNPMTVPDSLMNYPHDNVNLPDGARPYPDRTDTSAHHDRVPVPTPVPYRTTFLDFSILPVLRVDYGILKPGLYTYASDVLGKSSFFGGLMMGGPDWDRDAFAIFEFAGWGPTLFLELYNVKRSLTYRDNADPTNDALVVHESIQKNAFELREFDIGVDWSLLSPRDFRVNYSHPEYYVKIKGKEFRSGRYEAIPSTGAIKYFFGNDFWTEWKLSTLRPAVDGAINPRGGRRLRLRYGYYDDELIKGFAFNQETGATGELYDRTRHLRLEHAWNEYIPVPISEHTLDLEVQGSLIPSRVDSFYHFFGGGLPGLKGYSFYSIEGRKMLLLMVHYRFPLLKRIDRQFLFLHFDKVYGAVYSGVGNAWSDKTSWTTLKDFKRDIGFELRAEIHSFYVYPTRLTLRADYGLDRFTSNGPLITVVDGGGNLVKTPQRIRNGREWRWYATLLFGFTLFDEN